MARKSNLSDKQIEEIKVAIAEPDEEYGIWLDCFELENYDEYEGYHCFIKLWTKMGL